MKKYLYSGLFIILATNIIALSDVAINRLGEPTTQLDLTERELKLPYNYYGSGKENSGISLKLNWRMPQSSNQPYRSYGSNTINVSEKQLIQFGFNLLSPGRTQHNNLWSESLELYWALEYDGEMHQAEIKSAESDYQASVAAYDIDPGEDNQKKMEQLGDNLTIEKTSNSRLFFLDLSGELEQLADKYTNKNNVLIARGVTKAYYDSTNKTYKLRLKSLSVNRILVPLEFRPVFERLQRRTYDMKNKPRYNAQVTWGSRLEPWIVSASRVSG